MVSCHLSSELLVCVFCVSIIPTKLSLKVQQVIIGRNKHHLLYLMLCLQLLKHVTGMNRRRKTFSFFGLHRREIWDIHGNEDGDIVLPGYVVQNCNILEEHTAPNFRALVAMLGSGEIYTGLEKKKAEGVGQSQTRNEVVRSQTIGSLQTDDREGGYWVES